MVKIKEITKPKTILAIIITKEIRTISQTKSLHRIIPRRKEIRPIRIKLLLKRKRPRKEKRMVLSYRRYSMLYPKTCRNVMKGSLKVLSKLIHSSNMKMQTLLKSS